VETLITDQGLEVSDEDVEKWYESVAAETNTPVEEVKKYYAQEQMAEYLREDIKERKLFDILFADNKFIPGPQGNYLDLVGNNG
jgi:trigger factor